MLHMLCITTYTYVWNSNYVSFKNVYRIMHTGSTYTLCWELQIIVFFLKNTHNLVEKYDKRDSGKETSNHGVLIL